MMPALAVEARAVAARAREARNWLVFMVIKVVMIRFWTGPPCVSLIAGLGSSPVTGRG
jgi:hypothetical protein